MTISGKPGLHLVNEPPAPRFQKLSEWLTWQERLHFTAIELGLDRCRKVAEKMNLLPPDYFVISIAGTNGKGSSAVMLETILHQAGYRVGTYTSPHLLRYNERIRLNAAEVDDDTLCHVFNRIDQARGNISLTYFEFGTLAAMEIFRAAGIDIAIMEVGMGGRLDAVNMLDADVALISTVDIDHEQWLGHDRDTIGREKAGIFRSMRPAICADPLPPDSVEQAAELVGARFLQSGRDFHFDTHGDSWEWRSGSCQFNRLPIPGNLRYQVQNAAGVLMVLQVIAEYFPVEQELIFSSFRDFRMPGRFQIVAGEVPLIFDVAHNRQAATILADNIGKLRNVGRVRVILGMLKDKNHAAFINAILPRVDVWYLTSLQNGRSASHHDLSAALVTGAQSSVEVQTFKEASMALHRARSDAAPGDVIIVTGSFITVSEIINCLNISL